MEKINLAELLKNCPQGMELDCTICNSVKFIECDRNSNYPIVVRTNNGYEFSLTKYGQVHNLDDAKCVIFPKGKTSWEGFVPPCEFKDGDIVCTTLNSIAIIKCKSGEYYTVYCGVTEDDDFYLDDAVTPMRLAIEEEKAKLFDAIKENGYKWNVETKTLEKLIKPKFKIGDKVKEIKGNRKGIIIEILGSSFYVIKRIEGFSHVNVANQDNWKLIPDKFDISTLKPYKSEVLYRNSPGSYWKPAFWGAYIPENSEQHSNHDYLTTDGFTHYCIPFEGNEHLMGKQGDCSEYYKTWKE